MGVEELRPQNSSCQCALDVLQRAHERWMLPRLPHKVGVMGPGHQADRRQFQGLLEPSSGPLPAQDSFCPSQHLVDQGHILPMQAVAATTLPDCKA